MSRYPWVYETVEFDGKGDFKLWLEHKNSDQSETGFEIIHIFTQTRERDLTDYSNLSDSVIALPTIDYYLWHYIVYKEQKWSH